MSELIEQLKGPFNYAPRKKGEPHYLKVPEQLIEAVFSRIKELDAQLVYAEEENTALQIEIDKLQNELDLQLACAEEENADLQIRIEKLEAELYGF